MLAPGPESHPDYKHRHLPVEVKAAFKKHLGRRDRTSISLGLAAVNTIEGFLPIDNFDGTISDPVTALAYNVRAGNCRARAKVVQALLSPYYDFAIGTKISPLKSPHYSSVIVDYELRKLVEVDTNLVNSGLDPIHTLLPSSSFHAEAILAVAPDELTDTVSVEFDAPKNGEVEHVLISGEEFLEGYIASEIESLRSAIVFGGIAHQVLGQKGLGAELI